MVIVYLVLYHIFFFFQETQIRKGKDPDHLMIVGVQDLQEIAIEEEILEDILPLQGK